MFLFPKCSRKFDFKFVRIDGTTKGADRPKIIGKFNDPEDDTFIFLLSAKSGGVGLNLVGASRLILFDHDWNPSSDLQALARIYRAGQTRDTYIYRFITTGSIEEKIYQRQISKTTLSGCVIDAKSGSNKDKFSSAELRELFGTEILEFDNCQTHQIIECFCEGAGVVPRSSQSAQVEDSDSEDEENPYRIKLSVQDEKNQDNSALKMHELMKWEHHNWPVSEQLLEELCLKTCQDFISFIFRNQNCDSNEN
jgi:DNA repair and recombination protein RAD54B